MLSNMKGATDVSSDQPTGNSNSSKPPGSATTAPATGCSLTSSRVANAAEHASAGSAWSPPTYRVAGRERFPAAVGTPPPAGWVLSVRA